MEDDSYHWSYHVAKPLIYLIIILGAISLGFPGWQSGVGLACALGIAVMCGLYRGFVRGYAAKKS